MRTLQHDLNYRDRLNLLYVEPFVVRPINFVLWTILYIFNGYPNHVVLGLFTSNIVFFPSHIPSNIHNKEGGLTININKNISSHCWFKERWWSELFVLQFRLQYMHPFDVY